MAASSDWCAALNNHPISKLLRETISKDSKRSTRSDSRGLVAVHGTDLFVWDSENSCCLHTNLRHVLSSDSGAGDAEKSKRRPFQTLLCTNAPSFEVDRLLFSPSECHLALIGAGGLSVLELPGRWGRFAEFEGGKELVSCKTVCVGERYFSRHKQTRLLRAAWHPANSNSSHISILTSDDTLCTYNIFQPDQPLEVISLSESGSDIDLSRTVSRCKTVLGEVAVAFDFGPPQQVGRKNETVWPVYVLRGNGDVLLAFSNPSLYTTRKSPRCKFPVQGPLGMQPPAEDNYGTDACSILCLVSTVSVLVIATGSGKLHLCLAMSSSDDCGKSQSEVSWQDNDATYLGESLPAISLVVYESVELELSLTTMSLTDEIIEDDFSCPIRLEQDPGSWDRFHCCHSAGIHTVAIPWVLDFANFGAEDEDNFSSTKECVVEHLVCTKPLHNSPPAPVGGVAVVTDHTLGPSLLVLTNDMEFICLSLSTRYRTSTPPLLSGAQSKAGVSPLRKFIKEPFEERVRALLKRQTSNPLLRSSSQSDLSPQECFQLLTRATQVLREEYILKQELVREEIEKRVNILRRQKDQQLQDLLSLNQSKRLSKDTAESVAEKYEETLEKQEDIQSRIESVLKKFQTHLPVLSDAERGMKKDLQKMEENIKSLKARLEQIKTKRQYQQRQMDQSKQSSSSPYLQENKSTQLKEVLKQQNVEISDLMNSLGELKLEVAT